MEECSVLIGGKAGDGINQAGSMIARLLSQSGYYVCMYYDYPSLIRGGHNFAVIRASREKIRAQRDTLDYILAVNQETIDAHSERLGDADNIIFNSNTAKSAGLGLPLSDIIKDEGASPIMANSILIGAFAKTIGMAFEKLERFMHRHVSKETQLNIRLAEKGYRQAKKKGSIEPVQRETLPLLNGNEAIGLGLLSAGLDAYVAYPMTPSSNILHFLAKNAEDCNINVIHPESEIGVILMTLGFSYAGRRVATGTSGGGFCLMTESLSLAGMAEQPVVIVVSQRAGPSTGIPTYTSQSDLLFVLHAGHGEFTRLVVAPGDVEEAYYWSGTALNLAWKFQVPSLVLSDKNLSEGAMSFDKKEAGEVRPENIPEPPGSDEYKRYRITDNGISPIAFPPAEKAVIKANSYEHDEHGITTEDAGAAVRMYDKRLRKEQGLAAELEKHEAVKLYGSDESSTALVCWGSTKGVCLEAAAMLGLKVIQPIVLCPFPHRQFQEAAAGVDSFITVENNATGQLARLMRTHGILSTQQILKYNGRPFRVDELAARVQEVLT